MYLMFTFFRARPKQTVVVILALMFAGLAEGIGFSAVLPFLSTATGTELDPAGGGGQPYSNDFAQRVSDTIRSVGLEPTIGTFLMLVILGAVVKNLLLLEGKRIAGYAAAQVATDMRMEFLRAVLRSKWEFFLHRPVGAFSNSMATEAFRASQTFMRGITFITWMIQAGVYLLVALFVSWQSTLACLAIGIVIVFISHTMVRVSRRAGRRQTKLLTILISRLNDVLSSVKPLKAMSREHLVSITLSHTTNKLNRALRKQVLSSAMLDTTQDSLVAIVAAGGMWLALAKFEIPFATVVVLVIALERVLSQMGKVQKQYQKVVVGESAFWSMKKGIEEARAAEEHLGGGAQPSIDESIRFEDVVFAYEEREVLRSASLDIPIGKMTTITGPSGAGKTTLIDLLIALLRPQSGRILLDGRPLDEIDIKAWRGMIGYVPQETLLLHDTILNNVTLGDPELTEADAIEALKAAGVMDFVASMEKGLETVVGERGLKISGGQRQRIVIARALVNRPKLLILDEATSALDPTTEAEICATMAGLRGRLTILAISHQTALVAAADVVYRMEDGRALRQERAR